MGATSGWEELHYHNTEGCIYGDEKDLWPFLQFTPEVSISSRTICSLGPHHPYRQQIPSMHVKKGFHNFPSILANQCQNSTMISSLEACKQETQTKEQMLKLSDECQIH